MLTGQSPLQSNYLHRQNDIFVSLVGENNISLPCPHNPCQWRYYPASMFNADPVLIYNGRAAISSRYVIETRSDETKLVIYNSDLNDSGTYFCTDSRGTRATMKYVELIGK